MTSRETRLIKILTLALLVAAVGLDSAGAATVLAPTRVERLIGAGAESATTINPTNPSNLVVNDRRSLDAGVTWTASSPEWGDGGDPDRAFDASGTVFATQSEAGRIHLRRSTDGGLTYTDSVVVVNDPLNLQSNITRLDGSPTSLCPGGLNVDYTKIAADTTSNPSTRNNLYVGAQFATIGTNCAAARVMVRSTDGGFSWDHAQEIGSDSLENIAVGADGTVYVTGPSAACGGAGVIIVKSTDGGLTYAAPVCIYTGTLGGGFPAIAADPSNADRLYVAFGGDGSGHNIYAINSMDRGASWSAPKRVADVVAAESTFTRMRCRISVSNTGRVDVAWFDMRHSGSNDYPDFYYSYSLDQGATFSPNIRLSPAVYWGRDVNHYLSIASSGNTAFITYAQARVGNAPMEQFLSVVTFAPLTANVPASPTAFTASAATPPGIQLSWTAPANGGDAITHYKIYRSTSSGSEVVYHTLSSATSWKDVYVTAGVTYYYKITALNRIGEGVLSAERSAMAPAAPPSAPLAFVAAAASGSVGLGWSAPATDGQSPITNYKVRRGTTPGGETPLITLGATTFTYTDSTVANQVTYYYKVTAVNAIGEGPASTEVAATPYILPTAPTGLTASSGQVRQISLGWSAASPNGGPAVTGYSIYRSTGGPETLLAQLGNVLSYVDPTAYVGVSTTYTVTAVNSQSNESPHSAGATGMASTGVPTPPTGLSATKGVGQVALAWTPPSDFGGAVSIVQYQVWRGTTAGGESFYAFTPNGNPNWLDAGVTNGQTYYYKVKAVNGFMGGESLLSNEASATPGTPSPPFAPASLAATTSTTQIALAWTAPFWDGTSTITNYRIHRGTTSGGEAFLTEIGATTSYLDTTVAAGVTYYYKVTAKNIIGEGAPSDEASGTPTLPSAPLGFQVTPGVGQVTLAWSPPASDGGSPVFSYYFCSNIVGGACGISGFLCYWPCSSATLDALPGGSPHSFKIQAYNNLGWGPFTPILTVVPTGKTFVSTTPDGLGDVASFAGAKSETDAGAEAILTEANTAIPGGTTTINANAVAANGGGWVGGTPAGANGFVSDNAYATNTAKNKVIRYGLQDVAPTGTITSVILKAEVSILDSTPPPDDGFTLTPCRSGTCANSSGTLAPGGSDNTIAWDVTNLRPGGGAWTTGDINTLEVSLQSIQVGPADGTWRIDRVWAEVVNTPPAVYDLDVQMNFAGVPTGSSQTLGIRYHVAAGTDTFSVQVWDGNAWNTRGSALTATGATSWSYVLTPGEFNLGSPIVRFLDASGGAAKGILYLDYVRIITN